MSEIKFFPVIFLCDSVLQKKWFMIWRAPLSYECTWTFRRALDNLELLFTVASSNSFAFFVFSQPPAGIHNSMEHAKSRTISLIVYDDFQSF